MILNKFFLLAVAMAALTGTVNAQMEDITGPQRIFEGRLIMGMNMTQVDGDTYAGYHKVGLSCGPSVYTHFSKVTGVSIDILYSQKGTRGGTVKESYTVGTFFDKYYLNLNYIEVPVTLHYKWAYFFDLEAGLSYARLINSKEWAESDIPAIFPPDLTYFNKTDVNYIVGFSLQFHKHWYVNMRAQYSVMRWVTILLLLLHSYIR